MRCQYAILRECREGEEKTDHRREDIRQRACELKHDNNDRHRDSRDTPASLVSLSALVA